ncbi:unnamed protein product [Rotaria sordida]|uniref:WH1 domain-containing protein n=1 Tax=Rotaria sordida TaxID=392033 RepID=A0A819J6K7_9BILA|nr:unnamed protein product [Rotaria sordida]CAF3922681.1 unnamed protein product [Rotaria sordida]
MSATVYHDNSPHYPQSSILINNKTSVQQRPTHNLSKNLSQNEIQCLYDLLGNNCVTLATAVAQILHTHNNIWKKHSSGVLCFIKDYNKRTYYFRLYDLQLKQSIYEEIISSSLHLEKISDLFYIFDGMYYKVGINFIDQIEAKTFCNYFHTKQDNRQNKKNPKDQQTSMSSITNEIKTISIDKSLLNSNNTSKKQSTSKSQQQKKSKDNRPVISLPIPTSFIHIIHAGPDESFVTDDTHRKLFEEVLSNMPISLEEKSYIRRTVIDTDGGLERIFAKSLQDCDNQQYEISNSPPEIPPRTYLTSGQNNIKRSPHQDISIPSLTYQKTNTICPQIPNTSIISERSKAPIIPPRPSSDAPNNIHSSISIPPPLPPPRRASVENQKPIANIPPAPPLPIFSSEQITKEPATQSSNSQPKAFLQEILDYNKCKLKSEAERSATLKTSSINKPNIEVQRTLVTNIMEMLAPRRAAIMGRNNDDDDENDSNDDDEWNA